MGDNILKQMLKGGVTAPPPPTPARALRLAAARAAEASIGLVAEVSQVALEDTMIDLAAEGLTPDWVLLALMDGDRSIGFAAVDAGLVAIAVELQTTGKLRPRVPDPRPVTAADIALASPVVEGILRELPLACDGTALAGWSDGIVCGKRIAAARNVPMMLADTSYRLVRLGYDAGQGRAGVVLICLPLDRNPPQVAEPEPVRTDWQSDLRRNVEGAEAELAAVLHRMEWPLSAIEKMRVGQVIPLPGADLGAVRLMGAGDARVATGRLGQISGKRAIRIELPPPPQMQEVRLAPKPPLLDSFGTNEKGPQDADLDAMPVDGLEF